MSDPAKTTKPARPDRAGNQHARRHGWTSAHNPAPVQAILDAVDTAVSRIHPGAAPAEIADAFAILRKAERALRFRQEHEAARLVRQSIDLARNVLRESPLAAGSVDFALYAPESVGTVPVTVGDGGAPLRASLLPLTQPTTDLRIAVGTRPSRGRGRFPN